MTTAAVAAKVMATGIGSVLLLRFFEAKSWLHLRVVSQSAKQGWDNFHPSENYEYVPGSSQQSGSGLWE